MKNCSVLAFENFVIRLFEVNFMNFRGKKLDFKYGLMFLPGAYRFV
jgi:hypothetical protein